MVLKVSGRRLAAAVMLRAVKTLLALAAAIFLIQALWIPAKAGVAQHLLERSWQARQAGTLMAPPWPWADTQPVARLLAPELGQDHLVLDAPSGRSLAFGPVLAGSAGLDQVLFGHRDTHFGFLEKLGTGDRLTLEGLSSTRHYKVVQMDIIDSRHQQVSIEAGMDRLTLVTCYPFDALQPNGPLRYVVTAVPIIKEEGRS